MTNRIKSIELIRFLLSLLIVIGHFGEFFQFSNEHFSNVASVFVEFFFILSGFLMMIHIENHKEEESSFKYIIHKAKSFFLPLTIVNIVHFIVVCIGNKVNTIGGILEKLWHFKWEFLLLQCAGFIKEPQFNMDYLIGPTWYISAMMIAMYFAFYLAKNHNKIFTEFICPLSILFIYVYVTQRYDNINIGSEFVGPICTAVLRAFAGICVGVLAYKAYKYLETKDISKSKFYLILDVVAFITIPLLIVYAIWGADDNSIFFTVLFGLIVTLAFTNKTPIARFFNSLNPKALGFLGVMSLYVYLTHWTILMIVVFFFPNLSAPLSALLIILGTVIYSGVLYLITKKIRNN